MLWLNSLSEKGRRLVPKNELRRRAEDVVAGQPDHTPPERLHPEQRGRLFEELVVLYNELSPARAECHRAEAFDVHERIHRPFLPPKPPRWWQRRSAVSSAKHPAPTDRGMPLPRASKPRCGALVPIAWAHCVLPWGHTGQHRSR